MKWKAHAKLNLALDITGTRPDGYHLIDTIFQEITLCDYLDIEPADTIEIDCPGIPRHENIVGPAAEAFFRAAGFSGGAQIYIDKRIPVGAGLGGGSSDAAAVLCALNHMYGHPLQRSQLLNVAVRLGADIPSCINGGTQRAKGIGDILTRFENRCNFKYLLVKPEQSISTAEAYALYDEMPGAPGSVNLAERALKCSDRTAFRDAARNVFLPAAIRLVPQIAEAGQDCLDAGASFWMLTGSGSCIYSIFRDDATRQAAAAKLARKYPFVATAENCRRDAVR